METPIRSRRGRHSSGSTCVSCRSSPGQTPVFPSLPPSGSRLKESGSKLARPPFPSYPRSAAGISRCSAQMREPAERLKRGAVPQVRTSAQHLARFPRRSAGMTKYVLLRRPPGVEPMGSRSWHEHQEPGSAPIRRWRATIDAFRPDYGRWDPPQPAAAPPARGSGNVDSRLAWVRHANEYRP